MKFSKRYSGNEREGASSPVHSMREKNWLLTNSQKIYEIQQKVSAGGGGGGVFLFIQ